MGWKQEEKTFILCYRKCSNNYGPKEERGLTLKSVVQQHSYSLFIPTPLIFHSHLSPGTSKSSASFPQFISYAINFIIFFVSFWISTILNFVDIPYSEINCKILLISLVTFSSTQPPNKCIWLDYPLLV